MIRYGILLFPNFPMMAFASLVEPLRAANALAGRKLYEWFAVSESDEQIRASNGFSIRVDRTAAQRLEVDRIVACSGGDAETIRAPQAVRWIRASLRRGASLGAVADAAFFLAANGLLDGYRCTLHWTSQPAFSESFPQLRLERSLFVFDRTRFTAQGGVGAFDMMLAQIQNDHDAGLAVRVADWFAHSAFRAPLDRVPMTLRHRTGIRDELVLTCVAEMEEIADAEPDLAAMAARRGVSLDTLERAFRAELGETPSRHWRRLRLGRARNLLVHSGMPVADVALACGYSNAAAFARAFRTMFGINPVAVRTLRPPA